MTPLIGIHVDTVRLGQFWGAGPNQCQHKEACACWKKYHHLWKKHNSKLFRSCSDFSYSVIVMPLYEYRKNATNQVPLPIQVQEAIVCGSQPVVNRMVTLLREKKKPGKSVIAALDGWYGVDWKRFRTGLLEAARAQGLRLEIVSAMGLYKAEAEIENYRQQYVTDDPSFGRVNRGGTLEDLLDGQKTAALKSSLVSRTADNADAILVLGPGANIEELDRL